ncbi:MAG: hypothetical protein EBX50_09575 [Chitinophagia bacterium]|nr:hypothetical protein [Chitinophagia bacterium]
MNIEQIQGYNYPSAHLNKILHYWMNEKKRYYDSKELVYVAEATENSIGVVKEEFEPQFGDTGRSDWYTIENQDILDIIFMNCPVTPDRTLGAGILELNGEKFAPHVDPTDDRTHCLNYILNPGSANAETVWYEIKEEHKWRNVHCCWIPYDRLIEKERHTLKSHTWYKIRTDLPHSVENINGTRLIISIPLKNN